MSIDNHTQVFGNFCNFTDRFSELKIYSEELEKIIDSEAEKYRNERENFELGTIEFDRQFHFLNDTFSRNLRTSVIVSLVTIIENELHNFCNMIRRMKGITVKHNLFKGTILEQFKIYINEVVFLNFDFGIIEWKILSEIIELRNCIVHHDSNLEDWYGRKFSKVESIKNLSRKINSIEIDESSNNVILHENSCKECIEIVEIFFDNLYRFTLKLYPKT